MRGSVPDFPCRMHLVISVIMVGEYEGGVTVPFLYRAQPAHVPSPASRAIQGQRTSDDCA